ncbi:NADPH:quinone oxidoreductase family protein [Sphingomonas sp. 28-62-11]|uniref:quinone oxidoreductase family protein n=1 Tax=Sphingomonas sp. 28-62-11 TaxID=1970432 RepID=UPI000BCE614E|nr:MAG: NADP-dependent oxidoreductase [Sphingomonas sp. 28-62-11]
MKAAVYYQNGDPSVLRYEDVPDPVCHPKGVIIRVEAVSVEGGDTLNRLRGALATTPHIVGYQAAGEIIDVGAEVTHLKVGDRVATVDGYGSHAELRPVPARNCWPIPAGLDPAKAAVVPVAFGTAHECLFGRGGLKSGETALIQAGASGVGIAAIQLAKQAGATVIATASSDERLDRLKVYGLDHGINYARDGVAAEVKRLTGGKGADVVVDPVGGTTLQSSIDSLAYRGRLSMVGAAGREPMKVDVATLMYGNQSLSGVFLGAEIMTDRVHDMIQGLIENVAQGKIEVLIDRRYALSEAAEAHAYIESRQAVGRVILMP